MNHLFLALSVSFRLYVFLRIFYPSFCFGDEIFPAYGVFSYVSLPTNPFVINQNQIIVNICFYLDSVRIISDSRIKNIKVITLELILQKIHEYEV